MKLTSDNGKILIKLPGYNAGGSLWSIQSVDSQLKTNIYNETVDDVSTNPLDWTIGANHTFCCEVSCNEPGTYLIVFSLKRPWLQHSEKTETFELEFLNGCWNG